MVLSKGSEQRFATKFLHHFISKFLLFLIK